MDNEAPGFLESYRARVDDCLQEHLSSMSAPAGLIEAAEYSLFNGGKRVRPALVYSTARAMDAELGLADHAACAVELIHAYSLVHDDLPAMDNDALRRGKPTTHLAFNEATAILVGDALQAMAFQLLSESSELAPANSLAMVSLLARASGGEGMVAGQMIDLEATGNEIDADLLEEMHRKKTAALIGASVGLGALCSDTSSDQLTLLTAFGEDLGLAFQIQDDILDVEGDEEITGKRTGADAALGKSTWVAIHGLDEAKKKLQTLNEEAHACLDFLGSDGEELHALTDFITRRTS